MTDKTNMLTINAGSSSIKIALFDMNDEPVLKTSGTLEKIGSQNSRLVIKENKVQNEFDIEAKDFHTASVSLINWFEKQHWFKDIKAIGHRIVHGMHHTKSKIITDDLLQELNSIADYDPDHLPAEIDIIQILREWKWKLW